MWRCFFVKWTFPQSRVHYVQYQYLYFLFCLLLIWGGVSTHPTHAPAYVTTAGRMSLQSVPACGEI